MSHFVDDPAGVLGSDAHRQTLGHLSTPEDDYGWTIEALADRLNPALTDREEITSILSELTDKGLAEEIDGSYRQTEKGHEALTGPIANEPGPDEAPQGPAIVNRATPIARNS